ncbi:hypothetical protein GGS21DRAFT_236720 [Xylaria nigripes]|nr:hypothetical protein GGS21DRAFT_236720 [Xylaria nigripes]
MGTAWSPKWWQGFSRGAIHWRPQQIGLFILTILSISTVAWEAHRRYGWFAYDEIVAAAPETHIPDSAGPPALPGRCTTWPVSVRGKVNIPAVPKSNLELQSFAPPGGWKKPEGIAVKALIFYGRKRTVDFLDCYLQQNLAVNGGYLDEVWFMVHTDIQEDLDYLDELIQRRNQYRLVNPGECQGFNYACMWDPVVEDNTIYVKIDDDIIFIHPDAIPQLVSTRIAEPHPYAVSANLVNSPLTGYKHYDLGAIHPFVPDPNNKPSRRAAQLWRPSDFDSVSGSEIPGVDEINEEVLNKHVFAEPSYAGHPWLLLEDAGESLLKTPMGVNTLQIPTAGPGSIYGAAWRSWMIAAQQQYSLLRNLERNDMWRYHFGTQIEYPQGVNSSADAAALEFFDPNHLGPGAEQLFDTQYIRYNLNFIAIWGHDVKNALPIAEDDEQDITVTIPKRFQRPFVIDTRAVVGHLSFYPQRDGVYQTDLTDRWRAFANNMICAANNQKTPFDPPCPGY